MFPYKDVLRLLVEAVPLVLQHPLFWLLLVLVFVQYAKMAGIEKRLYGASRNHPLWSTFASLIFGVGIGSFGSLAMVAIGPIVNDAGILYVWPLAIVLMLVCPRMLCFAYAGGILSLTHLLFGVPKIGVPQLLTIIAVLHMVESILIWIDGYYAAIPGFFRLSDGQHTGGYLLQRFWIVPLSLVWAVPVSGGLEMGSAIQMPEWWPLIRTGVEQYIDGVFALTVFPIPVVLGYGDFSYTRMPHKKVQLTAGLSFVYSLILLVLAVAADRFVGLAYIAALFSPIGHELVVYLSRHSEDVRNALFSLPRRGVRVLDVLAKSQSFEKGVRAGDVILTVNGVQVSNVESVRKASMLQGGIIDMDLLSMSEGTAKRPTQLRVRLDATERGSRLGILLLPTPGEAPYVTLDFNDGLVHKVKSLISRLLRTGGRTD